MNDSWKSYRRDCWLAALSAALMLVGDLCLSVIPAAPADSGLFMREAYLSGMYPAWRLPVLLATGILGMALAFFTVRASYTQIRPQYRKNTAVCARRRRDLCRFRRYDTSSDRQPCRLDEHAFTGAGTGRDSRTHSGEV